MRSTLSHPIPTIVRKQQGSVLLICLILMIAVTLLGISSMKTSMVEHKIVSNTRNQTLALTSAETALNEATDIIQGQSGEQKRSGFQLKDLQNNLSKNTIGISLSGTQTINVPLWGEGAITNNASYLGSSSEQSWWTDNAHTTALSENLKTTYRL